MNKNEIECLPFESLGIDFNAFTNYDIATYSHIQRKEVTLSSMDLFLEGYRESIFDETDISRERQVILDESMRNFSDPSQYMWQLSSKGLWPDSMIGRNFFGDERSLKSITMQDIHYFQTEFYVPSRTCFTIIAPLACKNDLLEKIDRLNMKESFCKKYTFDFMPQKSLVKDIRVSNESVNVGVNYRAASFQNRTQVIVQDFLRAYMSLGWTSCLIKKLRDEYGLTYWVYGILENFLDTGYLRFSFSTEKENVLKALALIYAETDKLICGDIDADTVDATKAMMLTTLLKHYGDKGNEVWFYGSFFAVGSDPLTLRDYFERIQSLDKKAIQQEAKNIFGQSPTVALIGDVKNIHLK